jgi:hypothetical protein
MFSRKITAGIIIKVRRINRRREIKMNTWLISERRFHYIIVPVTLKTAFR